MRKDSYGGYGAAPFYGDAAVLDSDMSGNVITSAPPAQIAHLPEAPQALSCHHSEQVVTVPAEGGGTRQVTVTRC